jgi:hypothetical protein
MDHRRTDLFGGGSALRPVSGASNPLPRHPGLSSRPPSEADSGQQTVNATDTSRFGDLRYLEPLELWPGGESELLAWLGQNPEPLAKATGLELRPLAVDATPPDESLVLETDAGERVVVVVDMGESSDNALGRLMRTVAATGAKASIWAAGAPRNEHLASMSWLNRTVTERSFILQLRAVRIDDSRPAVLFGPMLRPSRHDDVPRTTTPAAAGVEVGRRADDWPSVTLIERGVDEPG